MTTAAEIIDELRDLGTAPIKKVLMNHGIPEPLFGVKVEALKKIQKRIKRFAFTIRPLFLCWVKFAVTMFRSSLYTTKTSLPGRYSHLKRTLAATVFVVELYCTRALMNDIGVIA